MKVRECSFSDNAAVVSHAGWLNSRLSDIKPVDLCLDHELLLRSLKAPQNRAFTTTLSYGQGYFLFEDNLHRR